MTNTRPLAGVFFCNNHGRLFKIASCSQSRNQIVSILNKIYVIGVGDDGGGVDDDSAGFGPESLETEPLHLVFT